VPLASLDVVGRVPRRRMFPAFPVESAWLVPFPLIPPGVPAMAGPARRAPVRPPSQGRCHGQGRCRPRPRRWCTRSRSRRRWWTPPAPASRSTITAWAGPWLVDERWWDPATHRRLVRLQATTDQGAAYLLRLAGGRWWVEAIYD
jgi:protein ImuB